MCAEPFFNEPGYIKSPKYDKQSLEYNEKVEYETLRVAVHGSVTNRYGDVTYIPDELKEKIRFMFIYHYDEYMAKINAKIATDIPPQHAYATLKTDFEKLKAEIDAEDKKESAD